MALSDSNISINDVKTILGTDSTNVVDLCTDTNINPWSKWKPINSNATTLTDTILSNTKYGIGLRTITLADIKTITNQLVPSYKNWQKGYVYDAPTGGASSPYRLGDFRNYEHNGYPPIMSHFSGTNNILDNGAYKNVSDKRYIMKLCPNEKNGVINSSIYNQYPVCGIAFANVIGYTYPDPITLESITPDVIWFTSYISGLDFSNATNSLSSIPIVEFVCKSNMANKSFRNYTITSSDELVLIPEPLHMVRLIHTPWTYNPVENIAITVEGFVDIESDGCGYRIILTSDIATTVSVVIKISTDETCDEIVLTDNVWTNKTISANETISTSKILYLQGSAYNTYYITVFLNGNVYQTKPMRTEPIYWQD